MLNEHEKNKAVMNIDDTTHPRALDSTSLDSMGLSTKQNVIYAVNYSVSSVDQFVVSARKSDWSGRKRARADSNDEENGVIERDNGEKTVAFEERKSARKSQRRRSKTVRMEKSRVRYDINLVPMVSRNKPLLEYWRKLSNIPALEERDVKSTNPEFCHSCNLKDGISPFGEESVIWIPSSRGEWEDSLTEMTAVCTSAALRRHVAGRDKSTTKPFYAPLSQDYIRDRVDIDDPLCGYQIRHHTGGWLQGFVMFTNFTTWTHYFKWDSLHSVSGVQDGPTQTQTTWKVDRDGSLAIEMESQPRSGDPLAGGVVFESIAEISLLGGLGCGEILLRMALDSILAQRQYKFVALQATDASRAFYERFGFIRVGAISRYGPKKSFDREKSQLSEIVGYRHWTYAYESERSLGKHGGPSYMMAMRLPSVRATFEGHCIKCGKMKQSLTDGITANAVPEKPKIVQLGSAPTPASKKKLVHPSQIPLAPDLDISLSSSASNNNSDGRKKKRKRRSTADSRKKPKGSDDEEAPQKNHSDLNIPSPHNANNEIRQETSLSNHPIERTFGKEEDSDRIPQDVSKDKFMSGKSLGNQLLAEPLPQDQSLLLPDMPIPFLDSFNLQCDVSPNEGGDLGMNVESDKNLGDDATDRMPIGKEGELKEIQEESENDNQSVHEQGSNVIIEETPENHEVMEEKKEELVDETPASDESSVDSKKEEKIDDADAETPMKNDSVVDSGAEQDVEEEEEEEEEKEDEEDEDENDDEGVSADEDVSEDHGKEQKQENVAISSPVNNDSDADATDEQRKEGSAEVSNNDDAVVYDINEEKKEAGTENTEKLIENETLSAGEEEKTDGDALATLESDDVAEMHEKGETIVETSATHYEAVGEAAEVHRSVESIAESLTNDETMAEAIELLKNDDTVVDTAETLENDETVSATAQVTEVVAKVAPTQNDEAGILSQTALSEEGEGALAETAQTQNVESDILTQTPEKDETVAETTNTLANEQPVVIKTEVATNGANTKETAEVFNDEVETETAETQVDKSATIQPNDEVAVDAHHDHGDQGTESVEDDATKSKTNSLLSHETRVDDQEIDVSSSDRHKNGKSEEGDTQEQDKHGANDTDNAVTVQSEERDHQTSSKNGEGVADIQKEEPKEAEKNDDKEDVVHSLADTTDTDHKLKCTDTSGSPSMTEQSLQPEAQESNTASDSETLKKQALHVSNEVFTPELPTRKRRAASAEAMKKMAASRSTAFEPITDAPPQNKQKAKIASSKTEKIEVKSQPKRKRESVSTTMSKDSQTKLRDWNSVRKQRAPLSARSLPKENFYFNKVVKQKGKSLKRYFYVVEYDPELPRMKILPLSIQGSFEGKRKGRPRYKVIPRSKVMIAKVSMYEIVSSNAVTKTSFVGHESHDVLGKL